MSRRLKLTIRIVVIAGLVAGLWWFIHKMDIAKLGDTFRSAKLWPIAVAAVLNFVCLFGKATAWRLMLAPRHKIPLLRMFRYTIATFAASSIAPARAGEVLRIWTLKRRDGVPVADSAAVAVAEKLLDGMTIVILVAPVPWLLPGLPSWVSNTIAGCAAVAVVLFVGLYIAVGRAGNGRVDDGKPATLVQRFLTGMHVLRSPRRLLGSLAVLLLLWVTDLGEVVAMFYAVGIDLPIGGALLTLFTLNLTLALPSTPAQVGALEIGALAALRLLDVDDASAVAFALLYHMMQVLPVIAAGLLLELRLVLGRDSGPDEPAAPAAESAVPVVPPDANPSQSES